MGAVRARAGVPDAEAGVNDDPAGAFARLYMVAFPFARRLAAYAVGAADAEDIAQEVCEKLFEDWRADPEAFEQPTHLEAWIATAVRNRVKNHYKTTRRREERQFVFLLSQRRAQTSWMDPDVAMHLRGLRRAKAIALANLSEPRRECFLRKHEDDATYAEIAEERGISVKTVQHHIAYAKKAIRKAEQRYLREEA